MTSWGRRGLPSGWRALVLARAALGACLAVVAASPARAQRTETVQRFSPEQDVGIDQRLGERVPLDLRFRAEDGREIELGRLFDGKPVILSLVYFECPMLCTMVLDDQVRALRALPYELGSDFEMVSVSIDPSETPELAGEKKRRYVESWRKDASESERAGWHFLTGEQPAIEALASAVGFRYAYDAANDEYAHAAGIMVLTPDGTLSRYLYGLGYSPRDLKLAIVDASDRKVGSLADQILVRCMSYDAATGKYHFAIFAALRTAAVLTLLGLVGWIVRDLVRSRRAQRELRA